MKRLYGLQLAVGILVLFCAAGLAQLAPSQSPTGASANSSQAGTSPTAPNSAVPAPDKKDSIITPPDGDRETGEVSYSSDPLLNPPPLPLKRVTMIGGSVSKIDGIRDRISVEPFGSKEKMSINFDERTHIYRDGRETTFANIHRGDRVYVDTMLLGSRVFARNIRVVNEISPADASGQVAAYNPARGTMTVQDQISASPVTFMITPQTEIKLRDGRPGTPNDLKAESLVSVEFLPGKGRHGAAKKVQVIALPGESFTFAGRITNVDLRTGMIAVNNQTDDKIYDIAVNPAGGNRDQLRVGRNVAVVATFTGKGYRAESIQEQK